MLRSDPLDIDAVPEDQLTAMGTSRDALRGIITSWDERTASVIRGGGMEVHLRGTMHLNYSDMPMWSPILMRMGKQVGPIAPQRAFQLIDEITLAWFDRYLKGKRAPVLDDLSASYPEAEVLRR